MKTAIVLSLALSGFLTCIGTAQSGDRVKAQMPVYFLGVNVGTVNSAIQLDDDTYAIKGQVTSNSVVSLVSRVRADFESTGRIAGRALIPRRHNLSYRQRKKKGSVQFAFAKGNIADMNVQPKVKYGKTSVPVVASHLLDVLDPISSLMLPVQESEIGKGDAICNRTLPVFDGKNRMNLQLRYKSSKNVRVKGFSGPVFTCAVRYQPVAGHKPERKETKFMKANRSIQISFARVGESNVYAFFGFRLKTRAGTASGMASRFQAY